MKQINQLPDLSKSFQLLNIRMELENVSDKSIFGMAILKGIRENKTRDVLKMIKEQAQDNRKLVAEIVGEKLLTKIENL